MYRIRLYIVPEQQEDTQYEEGKEFDDHWWPRDQHRVSVVHKARRGNIITVEEEAPVKKERRRWREMKNNRQEVILLYK